MRVHSIASRPHVQGSSAPLGLRHSAGDLTDGAGLLLLRRLWDRRLTNVEGIHALSAWRLYNLGALVEQLRRSVQFRPHLIRGGNRRVVC